MTMTEKVLAKKQKEEASVKAEIAARKAEFKAAGQAGKRVLIAKDVISQIKKNIWVATGGTYVSFEDANRFGFGTGFVSNSFISNSKKASLQEVLLLNKEKRVCSCCALGAMMLSCTLYNNKVTGEDVHANYMGSGFTDEIDEGIPNKNGLNRIFTNKQLKLIEQAFEQGFIDEGAVSRRPEVQFGLRYNNPQKRMIAIMNNIIKNEGEFIP
jgi:hypothetical protein